MRCKLEFEIVCGESTCAEVPGKFCKFLRWSMNGKTDCFFFGQLIDIDGWTQRHEDCVRNAILE